MKKAAKAKMKKPVKAKGNGPIKTKKANSKVKSKALPKKAPVLAKAAKAPKATQIKASSKKPIPVAVTAKGKKGDQAAQKGKGQAQAQAAAGQAAPEEEVILTNAEGKQYCRVHDCDNESTTEGYCRFHYLALWKRNKIKAKILQGGKLDKYIEDLTAKYPDKYLEMLRKDLASEKDFNLIVAEMDVEDTGDEAESEEDTNRFIEEVRGGMPTPDDDEGAF